MAAAAKPTDAEIDKAIARENFEKQVQAAQRIFQLKKARESLLAFTELSMPDNTQRENPNSTRYCAQDVHRYIIDKLEKVESGEITRLIINVGPRIGKSMLISQRFPAWFVGRDPYRQVILASNTDGLAQKFGKSNRDAMRDDFYTQVFPDAALKKGSQSASDLETVGSGYLAYRGVGGALAGLGADLLVIDDPIRTREEANSRTIRDKQWEWFADDAMTRLMGGMGRCVIVMTRWHEDDIVGRLTDPKNPHYNEEIAGQWDCVNIPAIIETERDKADDPFGRDFGEVLWEDRIPRKFLDSQRLLNPSGFNALYQGRPSPPDGDFFKKDWVKTYKAHELPRNLRKYGASDHAVSLQQDRDPTCMGCVGVDEDDNIWILPDLFWRQADTETQVEAMIDFFQRHAPHFWWAERGHISLSIGPFLRKRMSETRTYAAIDERTPSKDKSTRAQAIRGRMAMGKVFFPDFAPWFIDAKDELLAFPNARHDDFVDFISWIGIGLGLQSSAANLKPKQTPIQSGSIQWIVKSADRIRQRTSTDNAEQGYLH
jgi:predicted phage terminase large subunit-like protein